MAALAIAFPLVSLILQVFAWPEKQLPATPPTAIHASTANKAAAKIEPTHDPFVFHKIVAIAATAAGALWIQIILLKYERSVHGHNEQRAFIRDVLDEALKDPTIDSTGELNARLNIMIPQSWWRKPWWDSRLPSTGFCCWPKGKLYVFACSHNLEQLPEAGLPWTRNNGCAGELWASRDHFAVACLLDEENSKQFNLSDCQKKLTKRAACIISLGIFDGVGPNQRLRGFVNLDSNSPDAKNTWLENNEPTSDIRGTLQGLARFLVETEVLPH